VDGRAWIDSLPSRLEPQRNLLRALADAVDRDPRFRALALGCSIARNADELSDIDVGLWTTDEAWPEAAETTRDLRRASDAKGRVPELIVLLDRDGLLATPYEPPSLRADPERIREWRFLAWWELGNVATYLDRCSKASATSSTRSSSRIRPDHGSSSTTRAGSTSMHP
jgi:hypothetical protein